MYFSGKQLGDTITLFLWTRTLAQVPTAPDAAPSVKIWSGSALIETIKMPALPGSSSKIFIRELFLGNSGYVSGKYSIVYEYAIGGSTFNKTDVLEVVAGGDYDGNGISMHFIRQQAGDYVLVQGRSGRVLRLKNPSL